MIKLKMKHPGGFRVTAGKTGAWTYDFARDDRISALRCIDRLCKDRIYPIALSRIPS